MKKAANNLIYASTMKNARVNGTNTELKKIMGFAGLVSKLKIKNQNQLRQIKIEIIFMIARQLVVQKN